MYIKIFRNYLDPRTSNVPKIDLTTDLGSDARSGDSSVSGNKVNDDNDDLKLYPTHTSTHVTATTRDWLQLPVPTELPYQPSSLPGVVVPSLDDGGESPTTTPVLDTPSPSPAITDSTSALTPTTTPILDTPSPSPAITDSASTLTPTTSSSPVSTSNYPAPIFATPIVQGPAPNPTAKAASQSNSQSQSSGPVLSGGAIAAISVVAIMAALALGLWLYRKWSISKRKKRLAESWWLPEPFLVPSNSTTKTSPPMEEKDSQVMRSIPRVRPPSLPLPAIPVYLSASDSGASAVSRRIANIGVVRCIFEPRMGDELRIRVGEALRVLAEYDDGWGFCENVRGERGMIPLECLEGENLSSVGANAGGLLNLGQPSFARSSARKSSLLPTRA